MNPLQKLSNLSNEELQKICEEVAEAFAGEQGGIVEVIGKENCKKYIAICTEIYYRSGHLYTVDHTGYISFFAKNDPPALRYHFLMAGMMLKRLGYRNVKQIMQAMKGWIGYQKVYGKQDYVVLEMIAIPKQYQGQGRMKPLIEHAFQAANEAGVPLVLDTDTALKKDKYLHCGMQLIQETPLASGVHVYVLEKRGTKE